MSNKSKLRRREFFGLAGKTAVAGAIAGMQSGARAAEGARSASASEAQDRRQGRPNILILMTDQQRFDSLGCYGCPEAHTPNLDGLAREGVLFEKCYVNNPICTPSRASLLTGKTLPGHGVYRLYDNLPQDEILFTRRLQEAGYRTALFGKLHVSGRMYEAQHRHPHDGFDVYEWCLEASLHMDSPFNGYTRWLKAQDPAFHRRLAKEGRNLLHVPQEFHLTRWAAERTIDFIRNSHPDAPFLCFMSVFDPHNPYEGYPSEMALVIEREKVGDPIASREDASDLPSAIRREQEYSYLGKARDFSREELRKMRFDYHCSVAFFDLEAGRVLAALEEKGIADNTLVIFTSDHGDMLGDHGLFVKGAFFYDAGVRVPLIVRWPGRLKGGRRISQLVQLNDLAATVLSAAGLLSEQAQQSMPEARDLLAMAQGEEERAHEFAVCCYRNSGIFNTGMYPDPEIHGTMIRDDRFKMNLYVGTPGSGNELEGQLFDMLADQDELDNLWSSAKHRAIRQEMTEKLLAWETRQEQKLGSRGGEMFPSTSQRLINKLK